MMLNLYFNSNPKDINMSKHKNFFELLFGSKLRVKILKFLFRNPNLVFDAKELSIRVQEPLYDVRTELRNFLEIGLLKLKK